jgi:LacI family transcriptional regulator
LDAGLSVPSDLAIVGFDDVEAAGLVRPALTTIAQDREGLAKAAVGALRDLIDQPRAAVAAGGVSEPASRTLPSPRIVATRLLVRSSCGGTALQPA